MKRILMTALLLTFLLTGCSKNAVPKIDEYSWTMSTVQTTENNGQIVAHGPDNTYTPEDSVVIRMTCEAKGGVLTITDHTTGQTYTGTYKTAGTIPESATYEITVDGADGMAVVAMTSYHNGEQTPTLVMSVGEWAISFVLAYAAQ
ncbi:MAG: hypothetical protein IJZ85_02090 [Lachnospiraceae bacterium]|nr:hypothetical protein [Lachnospiraceae bacterium]